MPMTKQLLTLVILALVVTPSISLGQTYDNVDNYSRVVHAIPDGSLLLHAEDGRAVGKEIEYMPEWQAYGWFTSNSRVEWDMEVERADTFDVYLEWSVSDEESGKPFAFVAGDQEVTGTVEKTGGWLTFDIKKIGEIVLAPGSYTMTFKPTSEFPDTGALLDLRGVYLVPAKE